MDRGHGRLVHDPNQLNGQDRGRYSPDSSPTPPGPAPIQKITNGNGLGTDPHHRQARKHQHSTSCNTCESIRLITQINIREPEVQDDYAKD